MIKVYTPSQWYSLFQCASLIIEDDGMIYKDEDYYKSFRQAIGKIDYAAGMIYGDDYHRVSAQPIGCIKKEGDITKIYGTDYYRLSAQPILYIRDNRVYSADEFYKLFPSEAAFIGGEFGGSATQGVDFTSTTYSGSSTSDYSSSSGGESGNLITNFIGSILDLGFWGIVGVVFAVVLLVFALIFPFRVMAGLEGADMAEMLIMSLAFGGLMAFVTAKRWEEMVFRTILFSILGIFVLDATSAYNDGDLETVDLIVAAVFGFFIYGIAVLVPGLILGTVLWFIKRPFIKKKEKEKQK